MIRGTTPTHTFEIPFDTSMIKKVMIIYAQNDVEVFHKDTKDCEMNKREIRVTLSQRDTLRLCHRYNVQIQLRVLTTDGSAFTSDVKVLSVQKCLNDEVL